MFCTVFFGFFKQVIISLIIYIVVIGYYVQWIQFFTTDCRAILLKTILVLFKLFAKIKV